MADDNAQMIAALKGLSPADQAAMQPETFVNPVVQHSLAGILNMPKDLVDAAKVSAAHNYGPSPDTMSDSDVWVDPLPAQTTKAAMMLTGLGAPGAEAEAAGIFGGKLAKNADLKALNAAQQMASNGVHPLDVIKNTGWFRSPADHQWRFEIPDNKSGLAYMPMREGDAASGNMGSLFTHKSLYDAYPEIQNFKTTVTKDSGFPRGNGLFNVGDKTSSVIGPNSEVARSVMLHELQHGVQTIEGFSPGAHPSYYAEQIEKGIRANPSLLKNYDFDTIKDKAMDLYLKTAGEVESRNVQKRADFAPHERAILPPWETQPVPYRDQLHFDPVAQTLNALRKR